jgi:hypothetical protein
VPSTADNAPGNGAAQPPDTGDGIVTVKRAAAFPAARIPWPRLEHAQGMLRAGAGARAVPRPQAPEAPGGRLVLHVFAALGEFIRELIVEGTREGLDAARAPAVRLGRAPALTAEQVREIGLFRYMLIREAADPSWSTSRIVIGCLWSQPCAAAQEQEHRAAPCRTGSEGYCSTWAASFVREEASPAAWSSAEMPSGTSSATMSTRVPASAAVTSQVMIIVPA